MQLLGSLAAALLLASSPFAAAHPGDDYWRHKPKTCAGTPFTTIALSTVTTLITTVVTQVNVVTVPFTTTIPHSCYTQLIPVPQSNNAFCGPFTSKCGPTPDCIILSTFTQPCKDPCCPKTATVTTLGGCFTCPTGCATQTKYVQQTKDCGAAVTPSPYYF